MSEAIDPITQVGRQLVAVLQNHAALRALLKPGNLIDMTAATFVHFKEDVAPADTPEVAIVQGAFTLTPFGSNSRVSEIRQVWQLIMTHRSLNAIDVNRLKYYTLIALVKAGPDLGLSELVRDVTVVNGQDDPFGQEEWKRGTQRYVSPLAISVTMQLDRRLLETVQ